MTQLQDAVAQQIWERYVVEAGHTLPEGMADKLAAAVVGYLTGPLWVVDLERHNDGDDGLAGPFTSHLAAQLYVDGLTDKFVKRWAVVRPVARVAT